MATDTPTPGKPANGNGNPKPAGNGNGNGTPTSSPTTTDVAVVAPPAVDLPAAAPPKPLAEPIVGEETDKVHTLAREAIDSVTNETINELEKLKVQIDALIGKAKMSGEESKAAMTGHFQLTSEAIGFAEAVRKRLGL